MRISQREIDVQIDGRTWLHHLVAWKALVGKALDCHRHLVHVRTHASKQLPSHAKLAEQLSGVLNFHINCGVNHGHACMNGPVRIQNQPTQAFEELA